MKHLIPIVDGFLKNNDYLMYYRFIENYYLLISQIRIK